MSATVLPIAKDAEQQVIGSILLDPSTLSRVSKKLRPADFVDPCNRAAFRAILRMESAKAPIDVVAIKQRLEGDQLFKGSTTPTVFLAETGRAVATVAHIDHHIGLVSEASSKRKLHAIASDAAEAALNGKASSEIFASLDSALEDLRRDADGKQRGLCTLASLIEKSPGLNEPIVEGLFRRGETVNIIASPKVGKSWLAYDLALSIIDGRDWLGRFATTKGKVLLVDNELHPSTIAHRLPRVAQAMQLFPTDYQNDFDILPLRGNLKSIGDLALEFSEVEPGEYQAIILDAKYRFAVAGESENDNSAQAVFYNTIDQIAERTQAAIVMIHHSSKGEQSGKRVTDVGAGAGAQSRAADCHMVLREHEEEGVFVLDAAVRSFAPIEPLALRWSFPLWQPCDADTGELAGLKSRGEERQERNDHDGKMEIVSALLEGSATTSKLRKATGFSPGRVARLLSILTKDGQILATKTTSYGNKCDEFSIVETSK